MLKGKFHMSADATILIAKFGDGYRVDTVSAVENITGFPDIELVQRFYGKKKVHATLDSAFIEAREQEDEYVKMTGFNSEYGTRVFVWPGEEEFDSEGNFCIPKNRLRTLGWYTNKHGHKVQVESLLLYPGYFVYVDQQMGICILLNARGIAIHGWTELYSIDWDAVS